MRGHIRRKLRGTKGQSFVELALILPIVLFLLLGVVDLGKAISYWLDSSHIANEGARYAVVGSCPGGCAFPTLASALRNQAETSELKNGTTVCVKYPDLSGAMGKRVQVTVSSTYSFLSILHLASITITGKSTMKIEKDTPPGTNFCSP
jgi:hypothetical protein